MNAFNALALVGLAIGLLYLVLAIIGAGRLRTLRAERRQRNEGEVILNFQDNPLIEGEPASNRMRKLAAICAFTGGRAFSENFDFTAESIARLDRAIVSGWGSGAEANSDVIQSIGAYVGEVLVRRTRGRWVSGLGDDEPATVFFITTDDESVNFNPFLLVREKFDNIYGFDLSIAFTALEQKLKELKAA